MKQVFVDTSAWFALANRSDPAHEAVRRSFAAHRGGLVTSDYVFDEIVTLVRRRVGHEPAAKLGAMLYDPAAVQLVRVTPDDLRNAWILFLGRPDQVYSFTDCTSFTLMRRLDVECALALDADFSTEGFERIPA